MNYSASARFLLRRSWCVSDGNSQFLLAARPVVMLEVLNSIRVY